jgi:hypothetical protein
MSVDAHEMKNLLGDTMAPLKLPTSALPFFAASIIRRRRHPGGDGGTRTSGAQILALETSRFPTPAGA